MDYYEIEYKGIIRKLPIIAISPKIKVASVNLLGDTELVEVVAGFLITKIQKIDFDVLVGPEVKVVPLLHELSKRLGKKRYVICRKQIHGYMVRPVLTRLKPSLVLDGQDAEFLRGKKVVVVDDVVSSGRTMRMVEDLMEMVGAQVVAHLAVFKQGDLRDKIFEDLVVMDELPIFRS
jgi:adenine phosphoribosyltransferase